MLNYIIRLRIYLTRSQSPLSVIEAVQGLKGLLYYIIRLCIYLTGSQSPLSVIEAVQGLKIVGEDEEYVKVFSVCVMMF